MKQFRFFHLQSHQQKKLTVAIVGSGPGALYTADRLLKKIPDMQISIFEKLGFPSGLVRYGIAPDHQEAKFKEILLDRRVKFYGNISVPHVLSIEYLRNAFSALVLASGVSADKNMGLPREEETNGLFSSRQIVGWYNGHPEFSNLGVNLDSVKNLAVIGNGNVALDIARVFGSPVDRLRATDITKYSLDALSKSNIENIHIVGRRGAAQASFTTGEFRELAKHVNIQMDYQHIQHCMESTADNRIVKRLLKTMLSTRDTPKKDHCKTVTFVFFQSPKRLLCGHPELSDHASMDKKNENVGLKDETEAQQKPDACETPPQEPYTSHTPSSEPRLTAIEFTHNTIDENGRAAATDQTSILKCDLMIKSIGYKSTAIPGIPFSESTNTVPHTLGRVDNGVYVSGWLKTGPVGIIATTRMDAYETADSIIEDFQASKLSPRVPIKIEIGKSISSIDYKRLDTIEIERGKPSGKIREKIVSTDEMVALARSM